MQGTFVVTSDVKPGRSPDEYVEWYRTVHMPDVTSIDGVPAAHFYESIEGENPAFLAMYELDGPDLGQIMRDVRAHTPKLISEGRIIDSLALHMARPFAWSFSSPPR